MHDDQMVVAMVTRCLSLTNNLHSAVQHLVCYSLATWLFPQLPLPRAGKFHSIKISFLVHSCSSLLVDQFRSA